MNIARSTRVLTIDNGASVSNTLDLTETNLLGFITPAAWTAASLTLEVSPDGVTFYPAYDYTGAQLGYFSALVVSAGYAVDLSSMIPWRYVRLRSGTSDAPVVQTASRTFTAITRALA